MTSRAPLQVFLRERLRVSANSGTSPPPLPQLRHHQPDRTDTPSRHPLSPHRHYLPRFLSTSLSLHLHLNPSSSSSSSSSFGCCCASAAAAAGASAAAHNFQRASSPAQQVRPLVLPVPAGGCSSRSPSMRCDKWAAQDVKPRKKKQEDGETGLVCRGAAAAPAGLLPLGVLR